MCMDSTLTLRAEPVEGVFTLQHTPANHACQLVRTSVTEAAAESALLGDVQPQQTSNT